MEDKKIELFNCAKELFSTKGYKDTNVSDITKMAGVAVGTFYKYFESKEKLFLEIYMKENEMLKDSFEIVPVDDPVQMVKQIMALNFKGMSTNPILKEWYNKDSFGKLEKAFYEQGGLEKNNLNSGILSLLKMWKMEGKIRNDMEDDLILAMIRSIFYIDIHKEEIGFQHFPHILEYFAEFLMKGLTDGPKE